MRHQGLVVTVGVVGLLGWLVWSVQSGQAGPDPAKWVLHQSGTAAVVLLLCTLAVSTVRRLAGRPALLRWRRPFGLAAFFVATLHVLVYLTVFQGLALAPILDDLARRPYIMLGAAAFLMLVPLALTSTAAMQRRLGAVRWQRLHRLVYLVVPLAILHQGMAQKADLRLVLLFSAVAACFLIERMWRRHGFLRGKPAR